MTSRPRDRNTGVPQSCLANPGRSLQEQGEGPSDTDPMKDFTRASSPSRPRIP
jgi:hypothetical protein